MNKGSRACVGSVRINGSFRLLDESFFSSGCSMNLTVGRSALFSSDSYGLSISARNTDFSAVKIETSIVFFIYFIFFAKQMIVGTRQNRLGKWCL